MTVGPFGAIGAFGATFEIVPLNVPLIGALSPDATAFALPYSPAFTRQQSLYGPAFTAVTFQRNVACRPGASGPSGYVSTNADERSSGAGSSGGACRGVAVGIVFTTNCGRCGSATSTSFVAVENEPPSLEPHLTVTLMFGTVFWPAFTTTIWKFEVFARFCLVGKLALTRRIEKLPFGSFASCAEPPPHPAAARAGSATSESVSAAFRRCAAMPPKVRRSVPPRFLIKPRLPVAFVTCNENRQNSILC